MMELVTPSRDDMDPCSNHDPDVYATVEAEQQAARDQARIDALIWELLETDALTAREPHDGIYTVHEADLEHLVRTILALPYADHPDCDESWRA